MTRADWFLLMLAPGAIGAFFVARIIDWWGMLFVLLLASAILGSMAVIVGLAILAETPMPPPVWVPILIITGWAAGIGCATVLYFYGDAISDKSPDDGDILG